MHLFENDRIKSWTNLKDQHDLVDDIFFPVLQDKGNNFNHVYQNHHVTQEGRNLSLDKMSSKYIYFTLISNTVSAPISNTYFKTLFINSTPDLSKIYLLPHVAVIDTT